MRMRLPHEKKKWKKYDTQLPAKQRLKNKLEKTSILKKNKKHDSS